MDHVLNLAFPGIDSEALIVALKDLVAISNGSACSSSSYTPMRRRSRCENTSRHDPGSLLRRRDVNR